MKEIVTNGQRVHYVLPTMRTIALAQTRMVCASNGSTENYGSESLWGLGDDNE